MTPFEAGFGHSPGELLLVVASVLAALSLVWMAALALGRFSAWQAGQATFYDVLTGIVRCAVLVMLLGFFVR